MCTQKVTRKAKHSGHLRFLHVARIIAMQNYLLQVTGMLGFDFGPFEWQTCGPYPFLGLMFQ